MIERKIIVTGCGKCPFNEYVSSSLYRNSYYRCNKFNLVLDYETSHNDEKTHPDCMLPINIKSEHIK
jgi:hypothetical protein